MEHYRREIRASRVQTQDPSTLEAYFDDTGRWKSHQAPGNWMGEENHLLDDPEFKQMFDDCFGELPPNWRACMSLRFLDDRKPEAICQELDISVTNYWQIIHRAKLRMRSCLELNWEPE